MLFIFFPIFIVYTYLCVVFAGFVIVHERVSLGGKFHSYLVNKGDSDSKIKAQKTIRLNIKLYIFYSVTENGLKRSPSIEY